MKANILFVSLLTAWVIGASAAASARDKAAPADAEFDEPEYNEPEFNEALMEPELKEREALILITIQDKKGKPLEGVVINVQKGYIKKPIRRVSDASGKIQLIVETGFTYDIRFMSLTGETGGHSEWFDIKPGPEQRYSLTMTYDGSMDKEYILEGVTFDMGTANLKKSSHKKLQPLVEYMKIRPEIYVELSGHTDNQGDPEKNLNLSEQRANEVKKYLVSQGIDADRIAVTGYGDQKPIASNKTVEGRTKNRRTEVRIVE
ncbi:MAG: OmpA family protein [Deltaproteobacteria bacterium]|nr:OmpA family protein [Deltaproteobacteria bacterium]